ncbi:MAG: hypothetical protein E6J41_19210 [Chloroflexi bacterium]|nr:MAG: hypothetical protein E6J41_19210 [Chloroflexota bacterium]
MTFLVGVETAPLAMVEAGELPSVSEALLDALAASRWAQDPVTTFRDNDGVVGARFFIEAQSLSEVNWSSLVSNFLRCVVLAVNDVVPGDRLPVGTTFESGPGEIRAEPETMLARVQVEQAPAA